MSPSATGSGSQAGGSSSTPALLEFPAALQQKVIAGKTLPGTHVQANLVIATLLNGKVIPRNAVLSGEVIESKEKTSNEPARLSIRMDSAQWKGGSSAVQLYLTSWYYPIRTDEGPNLQYGPEMSDKAKWNGMGEYPTNSRYQPFPSDADKSHDHPASASSAAMSNLRVPMKDVELEQDNGGVVTLVGKRSNIKLDKVTAYLFVAIEPALNR
jgi:hypothetical protein